MCMTFGCNPQIYFCHFFSQFELGKVLPKHIDTCYLVNATPSSILAATF